MDLNDVIYSKLLQKNKYLTNKLIELGFKTHQEQIKVLKALRKLELDEL